ncbi:hypothetical protein [Citrobacter freundii]|uniref:Uncharacterized protein n=1 Tax=Citrobacter freundii TaxID=546 RepID=A0A7G2IP32_CITFR|nr:hypothetical protein [Citrobacter freundii]
MICIAGWRHKTPYPAYSSPSSVGRISAAPSGNLSLIND